MSTTTASLVTSVPQADIPGRAARLEAPHARHDVYARVHKGLRAWMCDVVVQAGRMDPTDPAEIAAVAANVRALMHFCRKHIAYEERFVHPAMEREIPGTTQTVAADHVHHERAIALIETELRGMEQAEPAARATAAQRLYRRIALFVAENFKHMNVEETEHNPVLWATLTDSMIVDIEQAIIASMPPDELAQSLRCMVPAMSAPERAAMFTGIRMNAPAEVVDGLLEIVRPSLSEPDWRKLCAALGLISP